MAQPDVTAVPSRSQLKPCEGVDRHRIGLNAADVAESDGRAAPFQQRADALGEPGQVAASDRTADGEDERTGPKTVRQ